MALAAITARTIVVPSASVAAAVPLKPILFWSFSPFGIVIVRPVIISMAAMFAPADSIAHVAAVCVKLACSFVISPVEPSGFSLHAWRGPFCQIPNERFKQNRVDSSYFLQDCLHGPPDGLVGPLRRPEFDEMVQFSQVHVYQRLLHVGVSYGVLGLRRSSFRNSLLSC